MLVLNNCCINSFLQDFTEPCDKDENSEGSKNPCNKSKSIKTTSDSKAQLKTSHSKNVKKPASVVFSSKSVTGTAPSTGQLKGDFSLSIAELPTIPSSGGLQADKSSSKLLATQSLSTSKLGTSRSGSQLSATKSTSKTKSSGKVLASKSKSPSAKFPSLRPPSPAPKTINKAVENAVARVRPPREISPNRSRDARPGFQVNNDLCKIIVI